MDPAAKAPIVAAALAATDVASKVAPDVLGGLLQDLAIGILPMLSPAFWGLAGALAVHIWVPSEEPIKPLKAALAILLSGILAAGVAVSGGALIGLESAPVTTVVAIVAGVGMPVIIQTVRANIGSWVRAVGDRLSAGPGRDFNPPPSRPSPPRRPPYDRDPHG